MTIDAAELDFLTSGRGQDLLAHLQNEDLSDANTLALLSALRKSYSPTQSGAALTLSRLRQKAVTKFGPDAAVMFFTDDALQQASDPLVRRYRAQAVRNWRVLDVGCGIGSDSIAFARAGARVRGIDLDPMRIAMARLNAQALGLEIEFDVENAHEILPQSYDLIFFDPARRDAHGKRIYDVEGYIPPLSLVRQWNAQRIWVKLSPGVDLAQLTDYDGSISFVSVRGGLKEALLRLGDDASGNEAVRLTDNTTQVWRRDGAEPVVPIQAPQRWLCEPDPAIIRAGLVRDLANAHGGALLDEQIAYFTTQHRPETSWLRAWEVHEWLPFNLKHLRKRLRQRDIGRVTIKKRGSPITPEELSRKLKLKESQSATLVLTRYEDAPIVLICADITP